MYSESYLTLLLAYIDTNGEDVCVWMRIKKATTAATHPSACESVSAMIKDRLGFDVVLDENAKALNKSVLMSSDRDAIINLVHLFFDDQALTKSARRKDWSALSLTCAREMHEEGVICQNTGKRGYRILQPRQKALITD